MLRFFLGQLLGLRALPLALVIADLHQFGRPDLHLGAQAELLVLGKVLVPVRQQRVIVLQVVATPVMDGIVVLLFEGDVFDFHCGAPEPRFSRISSAWSGEGAKPSARRNPVAPSSLPSTSVRSV